MRDLRGKNAVITGAASGIGRAIALELAQRGTNVYLLDIDAAGLERVAEEIRETGATAEYQPCDLLDRNAMRHAVARILAKWGKVEILVNNAGVCYYGATRKMTGEQWDRILGINLLAPIHLVRELLPTLLAQPEAHIVNVASIFGIVATSRCCAYHTSKFGLVGFSEALRAELGPQGIGVTTVCPSFVRTGFFQATSCENERKRRIPPGWLCVSAERVARATVDGIVRNKRLVLVSWQARFLYWLKRFAPGLIDWLQQHGRRRRSRRRLAKLAAVSGSTADQRAA